MKKVAKILTVLAVILVLAAGGFVYGAYRVSALDTNYPKLRITGIDVGQMTPAQTVDALNSRGWDTSAQEALAVSTLAGQSFTVEPLRTGLILSAEELAQRSFAFGRGGNFLENFLTYLRCWIAPTELDLSDLTADTQYLRACIAENQAAIDQAMGDAEYTPEYEEGKLVLKKGWGQLRLNEDLLLRAITEAVQSGKKELCFTTLEVEPTAPDFQAILTELKKEPRNASYTDDGRFDVIDEIVGCSFDVAAAQQLWSEAAPGEDVVIPMEVTWPEVTGQQLRDQLYHDLLGACTTHYYNSTDNRRSNLRLASSKIDGTILYPGDVFSYNTVVGERTEEAGFLPAPAYVDGNVTDEVGGGACQVSSTLYAATLFAFLETVEREAHIFPVHYMQLGTDATVTIPKDGGRAIDFKFKNSKNYPIKIVAYCDEEDSAITMEIWGTLEDDDYMPVEFDNTRGWEYVYDRVIEPADPNRPGYKIKLDHEKYYFADDLGEGYRTLTYRRVYDQDGNMVEEGLTNMLLENGLPAMDTYHFHNE